MRQKGLLIRHGPGPTKGSRGTVEKACITAREWTLAVTRSSSAYQRLAFSRGSANSLSRYRYGSYGACGVTGRPIAPASNPDILFGCPVAARITGVGDTARLDQEQLDLVLGIRLVLDPSRHDEHLS